MERIYLIGPVTGKRHDNRPEFARVGAILECELGAKVDTPFDFVEKGEPWEICMCQSIGAMVDTHKQPVTPAMTSAFTTYYDGIAMLDGWEESKGALLEKHIAEALGIPCRPWREYLSPAAPAASMAASGAAQPILAMASQ